MLHAVDGAIVVVDMTVKEPIQTDSILYQVLNLYLLALIVLPDCKRAN